AAAGQRRTDGRGDRPSARTAVPGAAPPPGPARLAVRGTGDRLRRAPGRGRGDDRDRAGHPQRGPAARGGRRAAAGPALPAQLRRRGPPGGVGAVAVPRRPVQVRDPPAPPEGTGLGDGSRTAVRRAESCEAPHPRVLLTGNLLVGGPSPPPFGYRTQGA